MSHNAKYKKLIYRSWHRGCKETDILLGEFAKSELHKLKPEEITVYEQFIEEPDSLIYKWLTGTQGENPQYQSIILKIQNFNFKQSGKS